ncbi:DNA-binding response regulator [Clostridium botulinum]|nr:DNA-binding response regulator [Clostridium botulinum]
MYSIILVEDDYMQRNILKKMILSEYEFVKIYEAESETEALGMIKNNNINIFLIDIDLKESSGLDLALKIRDIHKYEFSQIIFLTTYIEYLTQAFKQIHCYDYVLKPYNKDNIILILGKIIFHENEINKKKEKEVVISLKNGIYVGVEIKDIVFIEVKLRHCEVHTVNSVYVANHISLKKIMDLINCKYIVQSHRGFLVNINYIHKIEKIDTKLSEIYFNKNDKTALLGYKFKNKIISEFKKGKIEIC